MRICRVARRCSYHRAYTSGVYWILCNVDNKCALFTVHSSWSRRMISCFQVVRHLYFKLSSRRKIYDIPPPTFGSIHKTPINYGNWPDAIVILYCKESDYFKAKEKKIVHLDGQSKMEIPVYFAGYVWGYCFRLWALDNIHFLI